MYTFIYNKELRIQRKIEREREGERERHIYIYIYICMYQEAALRSRKRITDVFVHGASRHRTVASHRVTEHQGTSASSQSQSRRVTEQSASRTTTARMHLRLSGCITPCRIIAKEKLVVRQRHSSAAHQRGPQHTMENHRVSRRSRNIMDITEFVTEHHGAEPITDDHSTDKW